jgi:hypothetical protein
VGYTRDRPPPSLTNRGCGRWALPLPPFTLSGSAPQPISCAVQDDLREAQKVAIGTFLAAGIADQGWPWRQRQECAKGLASLLATRGLLEDLGQRRALVTGLFAACSRASEDEQVCVCVPNRFYFQMGRALPAIAAGRCFLCAVPV